MLTLLLMAVAHTLSTMCYYTCHVLVPLIEKNMVIADINNSTCLTASQKKTESRKSKNMDDGRVFKEKWGDEHFFVKTSNMALCLIFKETVSFRILQFEKTLSA